MYIIPLLIFVYSIGSVYSFKKCTYDIGQGAEQWEPCESDCILLHIIKEGKSATGDCKWYYRESFAPKLHQRRDCEAALTVATTTKQMPGKHIICKPVITGTTSPDCNQDEKVSQQILLAATQSHGEHAWKYAGSERALETQFKRCHNGKCEPGVINSPSDTNVCAKNKLWNTEDKEEKCYFVNEKSKKYEKGRLKYCKHMRKVPINKRSKKSQKVRFNDHAQTVEVDKDFPVVHAPRTKKDNDKQYVVLYNDQNDIHLLYLVIAAILGILGILGICMLMAFCSFIGGFFGWFVAKKIRSENDTKISDCV